MKKPLFLLPALVFGATFASAQVVVYTQPFDTTQDQASMSTLNNWGFASSSGKAQNSSGLQFGRLSIVDGADGEPGVGYNYINTNDNSNGNVSWFAGDLETPADPMSLAQGDVQSLGLRIGHSNTTNQTRWLVRIDNGGTPNWFVSREDYQMTTAIPSGSGFEVGNIGISANFADLTWASLSYDGLIDSASSGFAIITDATALTEVALPTGNITALGVYNWNSINSSTRFDDFTITAVPEPSTYAALLGLAALGLAAWRSRRR
jgi:hypothetical protein